MEFVVTFVHTNLFSICTSMNPVPDAQLCVYLTVHITKLRLETTFPKPLYIRHSACIHRDLAAENLDVCTVCDPWGSMCAISSYWFLRRATSIFHSFSTPRSKQTMTGRMDDRMDGWMDDETDEWNDASHPDVLYFM
jgi:hypothetical protein